MLGSSARSRRAKPLLGPRSIALFLSIAIGALWLASSTRDIDDLSRLLVISVAAAILVAVIMGMRRRVPLHVGLLVGIAVLGWVVQVRGVEPHRSSSRTLRGVATTFDAYLGSAPVVF